jgi:hypothetical protein
MSRWKGEKSGMSKAKKNPAKSLPKRPPRKSGKRGIGPVLDPIQDFETPTRKEPESAQMEHEALKSPPAPPPARIQNGKRVVHFAKFSLDRDKNRKPFALMDFSLELEEADKGLFPREIEDAWMYLMKGNVKRIDANGIPPQNIRIAIAPSDVEPLELIAAAIPKANVSLIVAKGKGKAQQITRLMLRVRVDLDKEVSNFCDNSFQESVWMHIEETQGRLEG